MIISQTSEEIAAAQILQQKCEVRNIILRQCHVSLEGSEQSLTKPFSVKLSHNSTANAILDDVLSIEVRYQIQSYDASEPASLLFNVECSFQIDYEIKDTSFRPTPEAIAAFKDGNAIFNSWAFAREFAHSMTMRMGLHPPPIPLLRIVPKAKPKIAKTPASPENHPVPEKELAKTD